MSAINVLVQPGRGVAHIVTDGVSYDGYGIVQQLGPKTFAIAHAKCAVASMGAGGAAFVFAYELGKMFQSFDQIIDAAETAFPEIYERHQVFFAAAMFGDVDLHIAGWSDKRRAPEAYMMQLRDGGSDEYFAGIYSRADAAYANAPFKLQTVTGLCANPSPEIDAIIAARYPVNGTTESQIAESTDPEIDLLHIMEMQRRMKVALRPDLPACYWVGGFALLTTISRDGVSQKVLHRWSEDKVGELVQPTPIDWSAWRSLRSVSLSAIPEGLSRLQRERMEKKARKGTLRSVI